MNWHKSEWSVCLFWQEQEGGALQALVMVSYRSSFMLHLSCEVQLFWGLHIKTGQRTSTGYSSPGCF